MFLHLHNGFIFQSHGFEFGLLNAVGQVPQLDIDGRYWSIVGLLLPLAISAYLLRGVRVRSVAPHIIGLVAASWIANTLFIAAQALGGFADSGVHLVSLVVFAPIFELFFAARRGDAMTAPGLLFGAAFVSLLPSDAFGSTLMWALQARHAGNVLNALGWLGGAGWTDGLVFYPVLGLLLLGIAQAALRLSRKPVALQAA